MTIIKVFCFIIGIPVYLISLFILLFSVTGFSWEKGNASFATLVLVVLAILNGFLFYKIGKTNSQKVLLLSAILIFICLASSVFLPLSAR
ncbi:hypothetical protein A3A03_02675 [Candidatus Nomurabacteria bacterium RIFCSPLOWO2_01_FULL_40_18]|uniref:Uncharacterized protein n=1 Tax=Candidatus Nomurabacteria bacterium RIFCSPLOWO2_01_FULL_40_18 TaxID=1801773 RepID=A0A1F6XL62_9BACT|nr:MAG: hypothetical protein A3A03_02675 [Candidatus Nomurabacteria bacterium RIFCSPLOWO2_01_FULL_40_18]